MVVLNLHWFVFRACWMIQSSYANNSCHMHVKDFKRIVFLLKSYSVRNRSVTSFLFALTVNSVAMKFGLFFPYSVCKFWIPTVFSGNIVVKKWHWKGVLLWSLQFFSSVLLFRRGALIIFNLEEQLWTQIPSSSHADFYCRFHVLFKYYL